MSSDHLAADPIADNVAVAPPRPTAGRRRRFGRIGPNLILLAAAVYFLSPLITMARFAFQNVPTALLGGHNLFKKYSWHAFTTAIHEPKFSPTLTLSLKLAFGTVLCTLLLLLPTALWVHLKVPKARPMVEFLTVLPYVVPPIAMVAGVTAFFRPNARWFINSDYCLIPFYAVLALPFTYRSIDAGIRAIDVRTLVDASRSLGAGWGTTMFRALIPNLVSAIVSSSFLTATVVMGEFTIASRLSKATFPVFTFDYQSTYGQGGMALALMTLVGTTALLGLLTLLTRRGPRRHAVQF